MKWLSIVLCCIGIFGIVKNKSSIINLLLSVEVMLVGLTMYNLLTSMFIDDIIGWFFGIVIITVAASESVIGLALLIAYNACVGNVNIKGLNIIKK